MIEGAGDVLDWAIRIGGPGFVFYLVVYLVRDRRKNRAVTAVAERTVGADVSVKDTAALEAHVAYVEKAFELERTSMNRQVSDLTTEVQRLRGQVADRDQLIDDLRSQVGVLTSQMEQLHIRLTEFNNNDGRGTL